MDLVKRFLDQSEQDLRTILSRWLEEDYSTDSDNILPSEDDDIVLALNISLRRADGKADKVRSLAHSYIVDRTLGAYYLTVSQPDLAATHTQLANGTAQNLSTLLHIKQAPIL